MEKISFLGDVYLDKEYQANSIIDGPFVFNLEAPISNKKNDPYPNKINLCIDNVNHIKNTFGKYPYGVNLANNHIFDYGMSAFLDTLNLLDKNGIFIIHRHKKEKDDFSSKFRILREKNYGISKIIFGK